MDLVEQLKEASRLGKQYRVNVDSRIDVHPDSYDNFASLFQGEPSPAGVLLGIPVYKKDYVPVGKAFLTTKGRMVVFDLS